MKNMEQDEVLHHLNDQNSIKKLETLKQLQLTVKRNGGRLPWEDPWTIFKGLDGALLDTAWEVRLKCLHLIIDLIPRFGANLDSCMFLILKNLVPALGDHKVPVRRSSMQAMHLYLTYTKKFEDLSKAIALYGLENGSESIQRECILALPIILTKDFSDRNFFPLVQSLAKKVYEGYNENVQELALLALKKLCDLVGSTEFNNYLQQLPEEVKMAYLRELNPEVKELYSDLNESQEFQTTQANFQKIGLSNYHQIQQLHEYHPQLHNPSNNEGLSDFHISGDLEFGVFPQQLIVQINRVEDGYKLRAPAVESLRTILLSLSKHEISHNMGSHMLSFIDFLDSLMDDANFKITTIALDILCILVEKLQQDVQLFLKPLVLTLARRLSNNKIVIRQGVMRVTMKLMHNASPKLVLCVMLENLRHKASRVRQEMINIVIAALLLFPSDEFDLCSLCKEIVPLLIDPKRTVRRAALECVAVIAQEMGQGRYQPLIQVVNYTEISQKSVKGLMTAVQARLARRHLPRLDEDGLVDYAMPAPSSATQRKISGSTQNADVEWVLAASGGSSSARYESTEDSASINESIYASVSDERHKRFLSAGKGKNKLPWDGDEDMQHHKVYDDLPGSAPAQKVTSNKPTTLPLTGTDTDKFKPKKTAFLVGPKDEGNDSGSYKQIYRNDKLKREHVYPTLSNSDTNSKESKENTAALWSTNKNPEDITKPIRTKLFPLNSKELDNSPIPMKPALARGTASGRSGSSSSSNSSRSEILYIAPSESIDSSSYTPFGNYSDEMFSSLKNIRDSASKRRAEKLEKSNFVGDSLRSSAHSVLSSDSGHYSISTFHDKEEEMKKKEVFPTKIPAESPFGTKPNLVRSNSLRTKRPPDLMYDTKKVNQWTEYSSTGISQSQTTDVCVFGKGYLEETPVDGKPAITKIKHQKRNSKDISAGTPLGTASLYGHGSVEARSGDITPGQDMIGVIGKGLNPADTNSNNQNSSSPTECFNIKSDIVGMSDGVHGLGISNCFKDKQSLSENNLDASTIDDDFMQISKTMRERMSVRRRKGDKPKQTEISNKFPLEVLLAATNFPATEKPGKPPMGPRIKPKLLNSDNSQLTGNSSSDLNNNPESLTSIPAGGLEEIQRKLIQDDWKLKCEALNLIRQLAKFHPNIFDSGFHPLILAVTKELDNLRSQVKRDAILCVTDMFLYLKRRLDPELDQTIGCLLALMAVSKEFIRNDVEKAFDVMIDNVTCSKALPILISKGLKHRSVGIRKTASYYVLAIAKKIGHRRLLSGAKDLTDKILQATLDCIIDASNDVRIHGKEILYLLLENPNLDQLLEKYLPSESAATLRAQMDHLHKKSLMEMSYDSSAPHSAKSLPSSRGGSAGSLLNAQISPKRPVSLKNIESVQEEIKKMGNLLSANDWRTRQKGLEAFKEMCEISPGIVTANITQVFDKFLPRLQDANSKVNLLALKILYEVIPVLHGSMGPVVNLTVNCVATNLSSKNTEIHSTAVKIIDSLVHYLEPSVLLRPFANQVTTNARRCPEIIPKITELVEHEYKIKPKQIEMHILPLLLHLLNCVNGSGTVQGGSCSLRQATTNLISALSQQMGPSLMEKFSQLVDVTPRHQQYLQDIMNHT